MSSEVAATLASQVAVTRKNGLTVPTQSTSTGLHVLRKKWEIFLIFDEKYTCDERVVIENL